MSKRISIIVLTYNSEKYIQGCLKSLSKEMDNQDELVVVDNCSQDSTIEKILELKIRKLKVIKNNHNYGFAKGINIGAKQSVGKYLLFVNPDTLTKSNSIKILTKCLTNNKADIAGGKMYKTNKKLHGSYVRKPTLQTMLFDYTNLRKLIPYDYFHKVHYYLNEKKTAGDKVVDVVSGGFMLIKNNLFKDLGMFDESFFMYLEDTDLCVRAKEKRKKVIFCPHSEMVHFGGRSSPNRDRINHEAWFESRSNYAKKHLSVLENLILQPVFFTDRLVTTIWRKIR